MLNWLLITPELGGDWSHLELNLLEDLFASCLMLPLNLSVLSWTVARRRQLIHPVTGEAGPPKTLAQLLAVLGKPPS